jgi:predicted lipid-binding transport protein (Tim44 family)
VDDLPQLAPLDSDPFSGQLPTSGYQLPPAPQGYYQQPAAYGSASGPAPLPNPYAPPAAPTSSANPQKYNHWFGLEQRGWDAGMLGGLLMMLIGGVWFVAGLVLIDRIFIYAPILFIIGLVGFVRGLFTGNVAGRGE